MPGLNITDVLEMLIAGATIVLVAYSPLVRALGNRLMHGRTLPPGTAAPDASVDAVLDDNAMLRRQLEELQERVTFTERLLAQHQKASSALPGAR